MSDFQFVQFNAREDNFGVLIHDPSSNQTAAVDAPETQAVVEALESRGWHLNTLLVTHHHFDHVAGLADLKQRYGCHVIGPDAESSQIDGLDQKVKGGDEVDLFGQIVSVLDTPGHTLGHVNYHLPQSKVLFAGDTLFSLGCGKLFEGTPEQMWDSLQRIMALPRETVIYVGHDYTVENGEYALQWEPKNAALQARMNDARAAGTRGEPTLPTSLAQELDTNPFLRPQSREIRDSIGLPDASDLEVFTRVRELRG